MSEFFTPETFTIAPTESITSGTAQRDESPHNKVKNRFSQFVREIAPRERKRKRKDLEKLVNELNGKIDYEAFFEYYRTHKAGEDDETESLDNVVNELYYLRWCQYKILAPDGEPHRKNFYDNCCRNLERYRESWEKMGLLPKQDAQEAPSTHSADIKYEEPVGSEYEELMRELRATIENVKEFNRLLTIYNVPSLHRSISDKRLNDLFFALEAPEYREDMGYKDFDRVGLDPEFVQAAKEYAHRIIEEYKSKGFVPLNQEEEAKSMDETSAEEIAEILQGIQFKGFEAPEGMVAVITPQEIADEMARLIPPDILRALRIVSRKDPIIGNGTHGTCTSNSEGIYIDLYNYLFVESDIPEFGKSFLESDFMDVLWHEFGHAAHDQMSYAEILDWEGATQTDIDVSWNVRYAKSASENRGKREDFADSFMLYLTNPAILEIISPERSEFMTSFFHKRLGTSQIPEFDEYIEHRRQKALLFWQERGLTPEQVRKGYLLSIE